MFHKILCPVDFSPSSEQAMRVAAQVAQDAGVELVLAHAWHLPALTYAGESPLAPSTVQLWIDEADRSLAAATIEARSLGVANVSSRLLTGVPWDRIAEAARDDSAIDLVVMGTHGRTGMKRFLLGSTAELTLRHAPCSVLVARSRIGSFKRALCAVDFSEASRAVIDRARAMLAPGPGGGLTLLHVIEPPPAYGEASIADALAELEDEATKRLGKLASDVRTSSDVPVRFEVRIGDPASVVLEAAEADASLDLIVVGSHGRTGLRRAFLGSVAEKIVRHADRSVLVAR